MALLVYIIVTASLLFLAAKFVLHRIRGRDMVVPVRMLLGLIGLYVVLWVVFLVARVDRLLPLGVDSCFDDWCAMVTGVDYPASLGRPDRPVHPNGQFVLLEVRLSNPPQLQLLRESQPRVFLVDTEGREWEPSARGQRALEESSGVQEAFVNAQDVQRTIDTELVFEVPKNTKGLKVRFDNKPGFWRFLLLPEGRKLVVLP